VDLCQFFTDADCSRALVSEMETMAPVRVLDMAAGHGSLTLAAMRRWQSAKLSVFDVDERALSVLRGRFPAADHIRVNLLGHRLPSQVSTWFEHADVVLCNPPFKDIPLSLADHWLVGAGMPRDWSAHIRQRSEIVFLAHNLRLLKHGGELGMILPAVFVNGHQFLPFRNWLLRDLTVTKVARLPTRAFSGADVSTYVLIARKQPPRHGHLVELIDLAARGGSAAPRCKVTAEEGCWRLDFASHSQPGMLPDMALADLQVEIARGWSVQQLNATRLHYFHTTDFGAAAEGPALTLPLRRLMTGAPVAIAGDILQARVGRACYKQTLELAAGRTMFSDCVYRIRVPAEHRQRALHSLTCELGQAWRASRMRGSTVSVLSKADLLRHPVWPEGVLQ
jgi:type I restriction enzyme M protein